MFNYFKECITTKYADFNGRARRKEYWYFILFIYIFIFAISFLVAALSDLFSGIENILMLIFYLGLLVPSGAVTWRRMHDLGKSGFYSLIPIYNIILACTDSQPGENEYGPNPKGVGNGGNVDELINSIGAQ